MILGRRTTRLETTPVEAGALQKMHFYEQRSPGLRKQSAVGAYLAGSPPLASWHRGPARLQWPVRMTSDRVLGAILGLVAGDRNGGPQRFALRLARSLVALRRFDPGDVLGRYLEWWRSGAFDTGPTAAHVFQLIEQGVTPERAARLVHEASGGQTAGVGPAHRVTPLGALPIVPAGELLQAARREARLTHWHPLAGWVAGAVALLIRRLVAGQELEAALEASERDVARAAASEADRRAAVVVEILGAALRRELAVERAGAGGYAPETFAAALAFVIRYDASFEVALERSIAFAGGANYAPVLVGAIAGARAGASAIPQRMLRHERDIVREFRRLVAEESAR